MRSLDDGSSRQINWSSLDPRMVFAADLATRDGWAEIRPTHWATAGRLVSTLRGKGLLVDRRRRSAAPSLPTENGEDQ